MTVCSINQATCHNSNNLILNTITKFKYEYICYLQAVAIRKRRDKSII